MCLARSTWSPSSVSAYTPALLPRMPWSANSRRQPGLGDQSAHFSDHPAGILRFDVEEDRGLDCGVEIWMKPLRGLIPVSICGGGVVGH